MQAVVRYGLTIIHLLTPVYSLLPNQLILVSLGEQRVMKAIDPTTTTDLLDQQTSLRLMHNSSRADNLNTCATRAVTQNLTLRTDLERLHKLNTLHVTIHPSHQHLDSTKRTRTFLR